MERRLAALETKQRDSTLDRPFLWPAGQSLEDALAFAGLTLDAGPVFPIELVGLDEAVCPLHERGGHLLN